MLVSFGLRQGDTGNNRLRQSAATNLRKGDGRMFPNRVFANDSHTGRRGGRGGDATRSDFDAMVMSGPNRRLAGDEGLEAVWRELCQSVADCAEGFAATDPSNAALYRQDAEWFCAMGVPAHEREMLDRYAKAAGLRESWSALFITALGRIPR